MGSLSRRFSPLLSGRGVVAGVQETYAPHLNLRLRVLFAVSLVFVPLTPMLVVTCLKLWTVLPGPELRPGVTRGSSPR